MKIILSSFQTEICALGKINTFMLSTQVLIMNDFVSVLWLLNKSVNVSPSSTRNHGNLAHPIQHPALTQMVTGNQNITSYELEDRYKSYRFQRWLMVERQTVSSWSGTEQLHKDDYRFAGQSPVFVSQQDKSCHSCNKLIFLYC